MQEDQYQLGIRKLSQEDLVKLVIAYRNKLKDCRNICIAFARQNMAQDPLHKIICAMKEAELDTAISDYKRVLDNV